MKMLFYFLKIVILIFSILLLLIILLVPDSSQTHRYESFNDIGKTGPPGAITWIPSFMNENATHIELWTDVESNDYKITFNANDDEYLYYILANSSKTFPSKRRRRIANKEDKQFWCFIEINNRRHLISIYQNKPNIVIVRNAKDSECSIQE